MCTERASQRGLSLIELVMFIAIVGLAIVGLLIVYNQAVKGSADPMVRKQAVAVAESLLNEVLMQPFSWCDPQDAANDASTVLTLTRPRSSRRTLRSWRGNMALLSIVRSVTARVEVVAT